MSGFRNLLPDVYMCASYRANNLADKSTASMNCMVATITQLRIVYHKAPDISTRFEQASSPFFEATYFRFTSPSGMTRMMLIAAVDTPKLHSMKQGFLHTKLDM
eukprot:1160118-Pelagomonas_calceolata.AAC.8